MRAPLIGIAILLGEIMAHAQGTVEFTTRSGTLVNAPVTYSVGNLVQGTGPNAILGQLLAGPVGGSLVPVGNAVPFRSDVGAGYITAGGEVAIPGTAPGGAAQVQMVAWFAGMGGSWETVLRDLNSGIWCGGFGESQVITVPALGGGSFPPALLEGLQGFSVGPGCPEPSPLALGLLGLGLFFLARRRV
jgi:MYXO-CTERM domain-containing protein